MRHLFFWLTCALGFGLSVPTAQAQDLTPSVIQPATCALRPHHCPDHAKQLTSWNWTLLELQPFAGLGGPVGLVYRAPDDASTKVFTSRLGTRVRSTRHLNFGLEAYTVIPSGFGANLVLDAFKGDRFRIHILDLGVFWNAFSPVSVANVKRDLDVTFGLGADIKVYGNWTVLADYRFFLPNPEHFLTGWGDFAIPLYNEAFQGGQLWFALGYSWSAWR